MEETNTVRFSLAPSIFAAHFDEAVIILDVQNDQYLNLVESAAQFLDKICSEEFIFENELYQTAVPSEDPESLNDWIIEFQEKGFITPSEGSDRKKVEPPPIKGGGLCEYKWDTKPSWKPFAQVSIVELVRAFIQLASVSRIIKRGGIKGILETIKAVSQKGTSHHIPEPEDIQKLVNALDAATVLYPTKTFCLGWASTFVLLALKKKWRCNLAIGVQTNPFYAHAWAEISTKVIHDDPEIAQVLSIILREPHF